MALLADLGPPARRRGRDGYTHNEEVALKRRAVAAGIGRWGRNSLLLHPEFGLWLRPSGVEVMAQMPLTGSDADDSEENPLCRDCNACVEACPEDILDPCFLGEPVGRRAHFGRSELQAVGLQKMCELCLIVCPVRAKPE
jgi:epoxyqueuosine reductase QueG